MYAVGVHFDDDDKESDGDRHSRWQQLMNFVWPGGGSVPRELQACEGIRMRSGASVRQFFQALPG